MMRHNQTVRLPKVAGQFYAPDRQELIRQVEFFLKKAEEQATQDSTNTTSDFSFPKILIVPHAGYQFSGEVAAAGYTQLRSNSAKNIKNVFLIGCSHQEYLIKAALAAEQAWQTPLGKTKLNQEIIQQLASKSNWQIDSQPHQDEHALEVQLPFLQQTLSNFKLVPMLVGRLSADQIQAVSADLAQVFDEQSLLVISSDLSHYPPAEVAEKLDQELISAILQNNLAKFKKLTQHIDQGQNLHTRACGDQAIEIGILLAQQLQLKTVKLFQYQHSGQVNSGQSTADRSQVVGYASLGFYK